MAASKRFLLSGQISRSLYERVAMVSAAKGGNVGVAVYGALRQAVKGLPVGGLVSYKVDRVPLTASFVVRLYLSPRAWMILDDRAQADLFLSPRDIAERVLVVLDQQYNTDKQGQPKTRYHAVQDQTEL